MSWSIPSQSMAIAPDARSDRAETSSGTRPEDGHSRTACRRRSVIISAVTANQ